MNKNGSLHINSSLPVMASGHDKTLENPESRLSIHEVPEQISRIFFGKPEVRIFFIAFENDPHPHFFFKHYEFLKLYSTQIPTVFRRHLHLATIQDTVQDMEVVSTRVLATMLNSPSDWDKWP